MYVVIMKILFILGFFHICKGNVEIEKYLQICDRNSPDVNDCLVDAIQEALIKLSDNGLPELGVPHIDPYFQSEIRVEYKNNQISAKMNMKNISISGMKNAKVHDVRLRADEDRFELEVDITTPRVFVKGLYFGEGRYNALHIKTNGQFTCNMADLVYTWKLEGKPDQRNDTTFIKIISFYMRPDVGDMKSFVSNIFPNNPELTQVANDFVNNNWRTLYKEMLPYAQENWSKMGIKVSNKIFLKVPYDQLFPVKS